MHNVDGVSELKMIGVFSKNREEWAVVDLACTISSTTVVPFFDSLGPDALSFVINLTTLTSMCIEGGTIDTFIKLKEKGEIKSLTNLICFDSVTDQDKHKC